MKTGHHPFHLPVGVDLDESDPEGGRCVRCDRFDGFPCLTDGKADAHVLLRAPGGQARERHPAHATRASCAWRPTPADARSPRSSSTAAGDEERYSADVVVVSCGAVNSAALLLRSASDRHPRGLANSSDVVGRHYMAHINSGVIAISQDAQPHALSEDARGQRLLLGRRRLRLPARAHPDARQERQEHPARRRAVVRSGDGAGLHGQARDRLLADHGGPAAPRQPRDRRPQRADPPGQGRAQHRAPSPPAGQAQGAARPAGLPRDVHPELVGPRPAHPARRRRAPVRHRALRQRSRPRRRSTSTARPTTSTTSTSSTRASSPPAAR